MTSLLLPQLLRAKDPIDLFVQVQKSMVLGMDLKPQLFVDDGLLCQWIAPAQYFYQYRLIQAVDSDDLEQQVIRFASDHFEMFGNTVLWNAKRLQWMVRWAENESQRDVIATTGRLDQLNKDQALGQDILGVGYEDDQLQLQTITQVKPLFHQRFMGDR